MLSLAQLFGYEQMNLFILSLARKFGLREFSGARFQWLVGSFSWHRRSGAEAPTRSVGGVSREK